jgi:hypothetical protein
MKSSLADSQQDHLNSHFNGNILFLLPDLERKSSRMTLLQSALESFGCGVSEKREYIPNRDPKPDVVITSDPHLNPMLLESLSTLSNGSVPIILDLDADFEKQPISHPEYNTKGLGTRDKKQCLQFRDLAGENSNCPFCDTRRFTEKFGGKCLRYSEWMVE